MRFSFVVGMVLVAAGFTGAQEKKIVALSEVPEVVRKAADRAVPKVTWAVAMKDSQGWYHLMGRDNSRRLVDFYCNPAGKDGYFHAERGKDEVPEMVSAALKTKMPNFTPKKIQAVGLEDGVVTAYRFQGEGYQGGTAGVYVSVSGKKVTPIKE